MADDRWLIWQAEAAGTSSGPSIAQVLLVFAIVTMLLLALLGWPESKASTDQRPATPPPCAQHWPPTCKEATRGP